MADKRWGWSALSKSRINDAYVGEVMMDKNTGEILIKVDDQGNYRSYDHDSRTQSTIRDILEHLKTTVVDTRNVMIFLAEPKDGITMPHVISGPKNVVGDQDSTPVLSTYKGELNTVPAGMMDRNDPAILISNQFSKIYVYVDISVYRKNSVGMSAAGYFPTPVYDIIFIHNRGPQLAPKVYNRYENLIPIDVKTLFGTSNRMGIFDIRINRTYYGEEDQIVVHNVYMILIKKPQ